jgi:nucleotidyltransferase/DNA polymerase involved in DNA repair
MLKDKVQTSLGITFSFGVATTKTLAKIASKKDKPDGLVVLLDPLLIEKTLMETPVASVWGVGRQTSAKLIGINVLTAKQFIDTPKDKILSLFSEPVFHTHEELLGNKIFEVNDKYEPQKSVQATRSMERSTTSSEVLWSELSRNVEMVCEDIRSMNLLAGSVGFFYKKSITKYRVSHAFKLSFHTDDPVIILKEIKNFISKVYQKNESYKGTGVSLYDLRSKDMVTNDLFGQSVAMDVSSNSKLKAIDSLNKKYGKWTVMHASSLNSILRRNKEEEERNKKDNFIYGLPLPYMGEAN